MPSRVSSPRFVGRTAELARLDATLARVAAGESAAVLVAGDAGMGKSRLVAEFERRAQASGAEVLVGECVELTEGELPYGPIVAALRPLVGAASEGPVETLHPAVRRALARLWPELGDTGSIEQEFGRGQLFEAVHRMIAALAAEQPVVLIIEDLHWADRSTRDLLAFLIRNARRERVVFVASYRTDEVNRRHPLHQFVSELERSGRAERVALPPFDLAELREQLTGILGEEPDPRLARRLYERSEGNPFFAEELLAAADAGMLPDSLLDALLGRVERLSEPARRAVQVAAAVGRPAEHVLLAAAAGLDERELRDALREAASQRILVPTEDGTAYAFRHELLREAVYADLFPGERADLHAALAQALSSDPRLAGGGTATAELAHHWHAAGRPGPALAASLEAASQAERVRAYAEAQRHLERAVDLLDRVDEDEASDATRPDLMRRAAEAAVFAGDHRRGIALARKMLAEEDPVSDPTAAGLAHARLARYLWTDGQGEEALANYEAAVELVPAEASTERAQVLGASAHVLMLLGRLAEARERAEEALEIARAAGARHVEANVLTTLAVGRTEDDIESKRARLQASREIAEELGAIDEIGRSWVNESHLLEEMGDLEGSVAVAEQGIARAAELGASRMWGDYLASDAAGRLFSLGRWDLALARANDILELSSASLHLASGHTVIAQVAVERGEFDRAADHLARSEELSHSAGGAMWAGPNFATLISSTLWQGEPAEASTVVDRALEQLSDSEMVHYIAPLYALGVRAQADRAERARALGREADATAAAAQATRLMEAFAALIKGDAKPDAHHEYVQAQAELARVHGGGDAEPWLATAEQWRVTARPYRAAYAGWRAAEAVVRSGGASDEATRLLRDAASVARELGARPLLDEVTRLARRARLDLEPGDGDGTGSRRRRDDDLGLTDRERDVLLLLAEGRTNRQIGERLFISEKTASVHVSRILAKLGVANRAEAAGIAHTLGLQPVTAEAGEGADAQRSETK